MVLLDRVRSTTLCACACMYEVHTSITVDILSLSLFEAYVWRSGALAILYPILASPVCLSPQYSSDLKRSDLVCSVLRVVVCKYSVHLRYCTYLYRACTPRLQFVAAIGRTIDFFLLKIQHHSCLNLSSYQLSLAVLTHQGRLFSRPNILLAQRKSRLPKKIGEIWFIGEQGFSWTSCLCGSTTV